MQVLILIAIAILFVLAAFNVTWPRFHPGWGGVAVAALYWLLQSLGQV